MSQNTFFQRYSVLRVLSCFNYAVSKSKLRHHFVPNRLIFITFLSQFFPFSLGTINNIKEAVSWISYTFLFVRMCKNPLVYGLKMDDVFNDPHLDSKRYDLIVEAAERLDDCMMTRYDRRSGNLAVTDLGRIASHFYIQHGTIEAFNNMLTSHLSDPEAMHVRLNLNSKHLFCLKIICPAIIPSLRSDLFLNSFWFENIFPL